MAEKFINANELKKYINFIFEELIIAVDERAEKDVDDIKSLIFQAIDDCPTIIREGE